MSLSPIWKYSHFFVGTYFVLGAIILAILTSPWLAAYGIIGIIFLLAAIPPIEHHLINKRFLEWGGQFALEAKKENIAVTNLNSKQEHLINATQNYFLDKNNNPITA